MPDDLLLRVAADLTERRVHRLDHAALGVDHDQADLRAGEDADEPRLARLGARACPALARHHAVDQERAPIDEEHVQTATISQPKCIVNGRPNARSSATPSTASKRSEREAEPVGRDEDHDQQQWPRQLHAVPALEHDDRDAAASETPPAPPRRDPDDDHARASPTARQPPPQVAHGHQSSC